MKGKILDFIDDHYLIVAGIILATVLFICWLCSSSEPSINAPVLRNNAEAQNMTSIAVDAKAEAIEAGTQRRIEDEVRTKTIKPKLETARQESAREKAEVERLKEKLKQNEQDIQDFNASRADNCARLAELFPDRKFQYCQ